MSLIKKLPEHLIGQIKAGEVVERPAALIKEILENSLDAGAQRISLSIDGLGLDLIALEDDGKGMTQEDLPLAFARHATSKIHKFDDLYALGTFGFRGEALASIASISRVTCTSVPRLSDGAPGPGGKIVLDGGHQEHLGPFHGDQPGTSLWVRDLFYNTPARLKFVRSRTSEKGAIKKVLQAFLLSHPHVDFSICWDGREKEHYPAAEGREARMRQLISPKDPGAAQLLSFSLGYEGTKVTGFMGVESMKAQSTKVQALLCNGRWFEERSLHQALARAMAPLWAQGESGHYLLCLDVPPDQVDVNVHPQKTQLKFEKMGLIFGLLTQGVESARSKAAPAVHSSPLAPSPRRHDWERGLTTLLERQQKDSPPLGVWGAPHVPGHRGSEAQDGQQFIGPRHFLAQGPQWAAVLPTGQGAPLLVDAGRLLATYWQSSTQELYPLSEAHISPLLISLPYKDSAERLEHLKAQRELLLGMGISLDTLSSTSLALRSVPKFLSLLPYEEAMWAFFSHLSDWEGPRLDWEHPHVQQFFASPLPLDLARCPTPPLVGMARKVAEKADAKAPIMALTPETLDGLFS